MTTLEDFNDVNEDDGLEDSSQMKLGAKRLFPRSSEDNCDSVDNNGGYKNNQSKFSIDLAGTGYTSTEFLKESSPILSESSLEIDQMQGGQGIGTDFNFHLTEGQSRRGLMADCESECSMIFDYLFVGGAQIARSRHVLEANNITRIINCSASVVDNHFIDDPRMTYLSLNMVDGRQDDISWFLGDVLQFILNGQKSNENILLHCERGVSRSCSFAIAWHIWTTGGTWQQGFDYVKSKRACCAPNTAFTCNLIEISECLKYDWRKNSTVLFRCASHLIPHDPHTPGMILFRKKDFSIIFFFLFSFLFIC